MEVDELFLPVWLWEQSNDRIISYEGKEINRPDCDFVTACVCVQFKFSCMSVKFIINWLFRKTLEIYYFYTYNQWL